MKKLTKVKLINWQFFNNVTFPIVNNVAITGDNGSGKSALLDAIQYVLTAGKPKYNSAANFDDRNSKRSIETYVRGKLGFEEKEYSRDGDVTTYIMLEFVDEMTNNHDVLGVTIEYTTQSGKCSQVFYVLSNQTIEDIIVSKDHYLLTKREFKNQYHEFRQNFKNEKGEARNMISNYLKLDQKYFELIPKALGFKNINKVSDFIYEYLLGEDNVEIKELTTNVRAFHQLQITLDEETKKLESYELIIQQYQQYLKFVQNYDILKDVQVYVNRNYITNEIDMLQKDISLKQEKNKQLDNDILSLSSQYNEKQNNLMQLEISLKDNDSFKIHKSLKDKNKELNIQLRKDEKEYQNYISSLKEFSSRMSQLHFDSHLFKMIKNNEIDINYLVENFTPLFNKVHHSKLESENKQAKIKYLLENEYLKKHNDYIDILNQLEKKSFEYNHSTKTLISILNNELSQTYHKRIEIKPFCEYINVNDEKWRNALECYLNTQRFYLIVEPEYYQEAARIYDREHTKNKLYGVAIINVASLSKYENITIDETLAAKIDTNNVYARLYANMILGHVHCVEHVEELSKYHTAITPSGMLYKNHSLIGLNPKISQTPFIGKNAIDMQKKHYKKLVDELIEVIEKEKQHLKELEKIINLCQINDENYLKSQYITINQYQNTKIQIDEINKQIDELENNTDFISLAKTIEDVENKIHRLNKEIDSLKTLHTQNELSIRESKNITHENYQQLDIYEKQIEVIEHKSIIHMTSIQEKIVYYLSLSPSHKKQIDLINKDIDLYDNNKTNIMIKIATTMNEFESQYHMGYGLNIESIDMYLKQYDILKNTEIEKHKDELMNAKKSAEDSFKETFISRLKEKIENAKNEIKLLNNGLKNCDFNNDSYEFVISGSSDPKYRPYYNIIMSGQTDMPTSLFDEELSDSNRKVMNELFHQLSSFDIDNNIDRLLYQYTDYRNYLDYDIRIKSPEGTALFSKVGKEKSGGETQTPFYVVMASSFQQLIKIRVKNDAACIVLFDEAFNNMDGNRIEKMMEFYSQLNIQLLIATPPDRFGIISPYVDTNIVIWKQSNQSYVEEFVNE